MNATTALRSMSGSELARLLGVSKQLVSHWRVGRARVPAERCKEIERVTQGRICAHQLRPDLFDAPSEAA